MTEEHMHSNVSTETSDMPEQMLKPRMRMRRMRHPLTPTIWGVGFLVSFSILFGSAIIALPSISTSLIAKETAKSGNTADSGTTGAKANPSPVPTGDAAPTGPQKATASIGKSPVLGNKKTAKVAIVEWTDFECPFCKQFHEATYDSIVKQYVDTGKAIFVIRNFPLSFHGEAAKKEAGMALCVRDASGDAAYFKMAGDIFGKTGTNGAGMPDDTLFSLASKYGVSKTVFDACLAGKYQNVIDADTSDGSAAGVTGTPGFVIGKLASDGTVDGEILAGAYPIADFQKAIDSYLK